MVLDNYSAYQELVHTSPHPLEDAVRLAIAGNVIDFGVSLDFDLTATVQRVRELSFALNDLDALRRELRKPAPLLYITDNAGEIVLDRLLIETILESFGPRRVILLVRSRPFLNDALRADALQAGIDHIHGLELYTLALNLDKSTVIQEIRSFFADSDPDPILLCKGQANYEYLSGIPGFFFLMLVKCTVIAQDLTLQTGITISRGDIISWRN